MRAMVVVVVLGGCFSKPADVNFDAGPPDARRVDGNVQPPDANVPDAVPPDAFSPSGFGSFTVVASMLHARVGHASVVANDHLYVIGGHCPTCTDHDGGGATKDVEIAPIDGSGNLGTFVSGPPLLDARAYGAAFFAHGSSHDYLYVVGGANSEGASNTDLYKENVERAQVMANGSLGNFADAGVTLNTDRADLSLVVDGSDVYVLAGYGPPSGHPTSIEHATIDAAGDLSAFTNVSPALGDGRAAPAVAVGGGELIVMGGTADAGNVTTATIETASLSGGLGSFSNASPALMTPTYGATTLVLANHLYVFGGAANGTTNAFDTIETADVGPLTSFSTMTAHIDQGRAQATGEIVGESYCLIGGSTVDTIDDTHVLASIACAPLQ